MAKRSERLIVIMVEPAESAEFEIWPLHITLVPWFHSNDDQKLYKVLQAIAAKHQNFIIQAGKVEQWGKKEKFEIQLLEDQGQIYELHQDLFHSLENNGFLIHQKDFLGEQYKPHLTLRNRFQKGNAFPRGGEIKIEKFTLINQVRLKVTGRMIKSLGKEYELHG